MFMLLESCSETLVEKLSQDCGNLWELKVPGESLLLTRSKQENIFHKLSHLSHALSVNLVSPEHGQGAELMGFSGL